MSSNKTLNKSDRKLLFTFAKSNITCPAEQAAFDAAYDTAKPFVIDAVHKRFPPADMAIMAKYGATREDPCIGFGGFYDPDSVFRFKPGEALPLVPRTTGCGELRYDWSKEALAALNAYVLARQAHRKALDSKIEDYRRLIIGSRTFNDVAAVWPAVEALRTKLIPKTPEQRALAVLSEETIARIKADNAGAQKEAA